MSELIRDYLRSESQAWVTRFIEDRIAFLRRRGIQASGDLERSLQAEVIAGLRNAGVQTLIAFEEYGRIIDMRRFDPPEGGGDYLLALVDWIQRKGLADKMIKGYVRRRKLKRPPERVLTYIAWGIARKRFNGKYKRHRWWNKSKSAAITELFRDVAANMPEVVAEQVKQMMTDPGLTLNSSLGGARPTRTGGISYQQFQQNLRNAQKR
ncbi:MAG: hypothetical protein AAF412_06785 [Pseudomonadota bacterium]